MPPMPLRIGETFAGYRVLRLLGSGGMGEVYLVQHPRLPRREALKVLRPDISADPSFRDRFIREADLAAGLRHPHIVGIHDRGEHDSQLWISMDFIEGTDLGHLVEQRSPAGMPIGYVLPIISAVASALDYAHKKGLLHRDVKPANIMVADLGSDDPSIFLADFGIARPLDDTSGLTTTNMTVGTVAYAAPEQLMGDAIDGRADQYALAATTFQLLTGAQLFPHTNPAVVISRHLNAKPPKLGESRPDLAGLDALFQTALSKNPHDRYPSCNSFAHAISQAVEPMRLAASTGTAVAPVGDPPTGKVANSTSIGAQDGPVRVSPTAPTRHAPTSRASKPLDHSPHTDEQSPGDRSTHRAKLALIVGTVILIVAAVSAVAFLSKPSSESGSPTSSKSAPGGPTTAVSPKSVNAIADLLPAAIKQSGTLVIGVNVPYAPSEFLDTQGRIAGFDVDLMNAIASTLGLTAEYREVDFAKIIPAIQSGTFDVGMSSFTDTKERDQYVDFVDYYSAGTLWAQRPRQPVDPNNACGKTIAVQATTTQETDELPTKSKACTDAGKPPIDIVKFEGQDAATNAVILGHADAMSADSPVTLYTIKMSNGRLEPAGEIIDAAPYGWPVRKGSPLAQSLKQALEHLIENGTYRTIATNWGLEAGMIDEPAINGAIY